MTICRAEQGITLNLSWPLICHYHAYLLTLIPSAIQHVEVLFCTKFNKCLAIWQSFLNELNVSGPECTAAKQSRGRHTPVSSTGVSATISQCEKHTSSGLSPNTYLLGGNFPNRCRYVITKCRHNWERVQKIVSNEFCYLCRSRREALHHFLE